jgi:hypothetical protein
MTNPMGCAVTPVCTLTHRAGLASLASHEEGTPGATFRDRFGYNSMSYLLPRHAFPSARTQQRSLLRGHDPWLRSLATRHGSLFPKADA